MFKGIEHFAIASPDPRRLAEFYVTTLNFSIAHEYDGNYFVQDAGGALIEIVPAVGDKPVNEMRTPGLRHIAIAVDDFDAAHRHLLERGVVMEGSPYTNSGNRLVFFRDPDGTLLHLIHREKPLR